LISNTQPPPIQIGGGFFLNAIKMAIQKNRPFVAKIFNLLF